MLIYANKIWNKYIVKISCQVYFLEMATVAKGADLESRGSDEEGEGRYCAWQIVSHIAPVIHHGRHAEKYWFSCFAS